jgi:hypothetical protein
MPYVVEKDGTSVLEVLGERSTRRAGETKTYYETVGHVFNEGDVFSFEVLPAQLEKEDNNLREISEKEAEKLQGGNSVGYQDAFQAENAGPLDEPRKVQRGFTGQDLEQNEEAQTIVEDSIEAPEVKSASKSSKKSSE